uniref:Nudix hydrolase domain-containing protein n=1 Tax=Glycine max TaxID=3847 RepID=K7KRE3_SOYBN
MEFYFRHVDARAYKIYINSIHKLSNLWGFVSRATRQHDVSRCPHWQRYDDGCRQVVGYQNKELEVLVISAQKGNGMQFPKGGWESDESMEQAALRETIEEAGD